MLRKDAGKAGETGPCIYALSAWQVSRLFTDEERAVLAFAEEITHISCHGVTDVIYQSLQRYFSEYQIAQITIGFGWINFGTSSALHAGCFFFTSQCKTVRKRLKDKNAITPDE